MNNDQNDGWLVFMVIVTACLLASIATAAIVWSETKREALKNNCGQYNAKTGAFEWVRQQPLPTGKPDES